MSSRGRVFGAALCLFSSVLITEMGAHQTVRASNSIGTGVVNLNWDQAQSIPQDLVVYSRVRWWSGTEWNEDTAGVPLGTVVNSAPIRGFWDDFYGGGLSIVGLPAGTLTVVIDVVEVDGDEVVPIPGTAHAERVTVPEGTAAKCADPTVTLCGTVDAPQESQAVVRLDFGSDAQDVPVTDGAFAWRAPTDDTSSDLVLGDSDWISVSIGIRGSSGNFDSNNSIRRKVIMPRTASLNLESLGSLGMPREVASFSGEISEIVGSKTQQLGNTDFGRLCVVFLDPSGGSIPSCATPGEGFGVDAEVPGKWTVKVPRNYYRVQFIDYPALDSAGHVVAAAKLLSAYWKEGGGSQDLESSTILPASTFKEGVDVSLVAMPTYGQSATLEINVSGIPLNVDVASLSGYVQLTDATYARGGEIGMPRGAIPAQVTYDAVRRTIRAVARVRAGAEYIAAMNFADANNNASAWVIGGSLMERAKRLRAGSVVNELWQPGPMLVPIRSSNARPFDEGDVCITLISLSALDDTPSASSCSEAPIPGVKNVVWLQQVPLGHYRVIAYQRDPDTGAAVGTPYVIEDFEVANDLVAYGAFGGPRWLRGMEHATDKDPKGFFIPLTNNSAPEKKLLVTVLNPDGTPDSSAGFQVQRASSGATRWVWARPVDERMGQYVVPVRDGQTYRVRFTSSGWGLTTWTWSDMDYSLPKLPSLPTFTISKNLPTTKVRLNGYSDVEVVYGLTNTTLLQPDVSIDPEIPQQSVVVVAPNPLPWAFRLFEASGLPVSVGGACVEVTAVRSNDWSPEPPPLTASACVGPNEGMVTLPRVPLGRYHVRVYRPATPEVALLDYFDNSLFFAQAEFLLDPSTVPNSVSEAVRNVTELDLPGSEVSASSTRIFRSTSLALGQSAKPQTGRRVTAFATGAKATNLSKFFARAVPVPKNILKYLRPFSVKISVAGRGVVKTSIWYLKCPGSCSARFPSRRSITLTAQAASGSKFVRWTGACAKAGSNPKCVLKAGIGVTATAKFAVVPRR